MFFSWTFILLFFIGTALTLVSQPNLAALAWLTLCSFWLVDLLIVLAKRPPLVERSFDSPAMQSQTVLVSLKVTNQRHFKLICVIKDEPPFEVAIASRHWGKLTIPPGDSAVFQYRLKPSRRGSFNFGQINLRLQGPLGLFVRQYRLGSSQNLQVYPNVSKITGFAAKLSKIQFSGKHQHQFYGLNGDFAQLREFMPGDDFRKINWKVTAHSGKPIINQFQPESGQNIFLLFDTGRLLYDQLNTKQNRLDYIVDSALVLAYNILNAGDLVGALSFNLNVDRYLPSGKGSTQWQLLLTELFNLNAVMVESDYREAFTFWQQRVKKRSLVFLYTDITDPESSRDLIENLKLISRRHMVVCILLKPDYLDQAAAAAITDEAAAYLKGAAYELLAERKNLKKILSVNGIRVLEVKSANIAETVVQHYHYLKSAGLF